MPLTIEVLDAKTKEWKLLSRVECTDKELSVISNKKKNGESEYYSFDCDGDQSTVTKLEGTTKTGLTAINPETDVATEIAIFKSSKEIARLRAGEPPFFLHVQSDKGKQTLLRLSHKA